MSRDYLLRVANLSKSFPGVRALEGVRLDLEPGTVHALMGENGAGKSTLAKILAGHDQPDAGEIQFKGRRIQPQNPHEAQHLGIALIHQELLPFRELTVAENIFMGREPARGFLGWLDRRALEQAAGDLLRRLDVPVSPARLMRDLGVAEMQTVEIAKALSCQAELIIMDEPTSALSPREVAALFAVIRDLKQRGVTVIYISHKLPEVFQIADSITVLRDGRHVATHPVGELDEPRLVSLMVGRELSTAFTSPQPPTATRPDSAAGAAALAVRRLSKHGGFQAVDFAVRRGEVVGIAGLMGAGRTALVNALYGLAPADAGDILVAGQPVRVRCPRDALNHGIALVSEDRQLYGLVLKLSVKHNLTLHDLCRCCRGPFILPQQEDRLTDQCLDTFAIRAASRDQAVKYLSGGNQQKLVLAKALLTEPDILLLDEPTRGIDIGAKAEIYALIHRLAQAGKAIVLVSSELPEILALSHRLLVMCQGRITAELDPRRASPDDILRHAMP